MYLYMDVEMLFQLSLCVGMRKCEDAERTFPFMQGCDMGKRPGEKLEEHLHNIGNSSGECISTFMHPTILGKLLEEIRKLGTASLHCPIPQYGKYCGRKVFTAFHHFHMHTILALGIKVGMASSYR